MENKEKKGFNRTVYFVVLGVVTGICVMVGAFMWGTRMGRKIVSEIKVIKDIRPINDENLVQSDMNLDAFSSIDIDADLMNLVITSGDDFSISYDGSDKLRPSFEVDDGKLIIKQTGEVTFLIPTEVTFSAKVNVTVPRDTQLDEVGVVLDLGDIRMFDLSMNELDMKASLGNVNLSNVVVAKTADLELNLGDLDVENCTINEADVKMDLGDTDVKATIGKLTVKCDLGDIKVSPINQDAKLDLKCDLGDVTVNGNKMGSKYEN